MTNQRVLFVTDFDGTLTAKDTSHLSFRSTGKFKQARPDERVALLDEIRNRGVTYMKEYQQLFDQLVQQHRTTTDHHTGNITNFLKQIDDFNIQSRVALARDHRFDDVTTDGIEELSGEIVFNTHAREAVRGFNDHESVACKILSVNWFPDLLVASMHGIVSADDVIASKLPVLQGTGNKGVGNEKNGDEGGVDHGQVSTALGKAEWMRKLHNTYRGHVSVYVGDSVTDMGALLEAHHGIVFGRSSTVVTVAAIFGIRIVPLDSILDGGNEENQGGVGTKVLYSTTCWHEIEMFVNHLVVRNVCA